MQTVLEAPPPRPTASSQIASSQFPSGGPDYRKRLQPTARGWPRRDHWCVWLEPNSGAASALRWEQIWRQAVEAALASWGALVPITRVESPEQAQVRILRRRPPLREGRASHGRAELSLAMVERQGQLQLEPLVLVNLSPGQRPQALQATALHELGHAFGLWGHSDHPGDAMAAVPGATPILQLSPRDQATFNWLQRQAGLH